MFIHCLHHGFSALVALCLTLRQVVEVRNFCCSKQVGSTVRACSNARTATDACGRIHCGIGNRFWNWNEVCIWCTTGYGSDKSTRFDDAVERTTIDHEVLNDRECSCSPRLNHDRVATLERTHVQLASCRCFLRTMCNTVNHQRTRSANSFAAIVVKHHSFFVVAN